MIDRHYQKKFNILWWILGTTMLMDSLNGLFMLLGSGNALVENIVPGIRLLFLLYFFYLLIKEAVEYLHIVIALTFCSVFSLLIIFFQRQDFDEFIINTLQKVNAITICKYSTASFISK